MKKTTVLLFTVLLVFMGSRQVLGLDPNLLRGEQEQMSDQIRILDEEIKISDTLINEIDHIIVLYQQQKTALVNKRAELNALKVILHSASVINSQPFQGSKGPIGDAVLGTAGAIGLAATGNIVGATVAAAHVVNQAVNTAIQTADEHNAKIEQKLTEQREWKEKHPGRIK